MCLPQNTPTSITQAINQGLILPHPQFHRLCSSGIHWKPIPNIGVFSLYYRDRLNKRKLQSFTVYSVTGSQTAVFSFTYIKHPNKSSSRTSSLHIGHYLKWSFSEPNLCLLAIGEFPSGCGYKSKKCPQSSAHKPTVSHWIGGAKMPLKETCQCDLTLFIS